MRSISVLAGLLAAGSLYAGHWPQYRGPQGQGIAHAGKLPAEFGPDKNLVWKVDVAPGHSSPVLTEDRIFLTAYENEKLWVLCLDRSDGSELWRRDVPRPRQEIHQSTHGPASPTPVTDGSNVYAFFGDFGLISFDGGGRERWRLPLGPFANINGHGSSPILADGKLILVVDQNADSYLLAVDPENGEILWKTDRSETTRGYGTAGVFRPTDAPTQLVIPGAYRIISYELATGKKLWWVNGMAWQLKCVPIFEGNKIYINAWEIGGDPGQGKETLAYDDVLAKHDADKDGLISKQEVPDERLARDRSWLEHDLDADGFMGRRDWEFYAARRAPTNNLVAIRPDGQTGDLSTRGVLWRYAKSLPNTPSPLLWGRYLYLVKDGGIAQNVDVETGQPAKLARLPEQAIAKYWASPVAGDGKIYLTSETCAITVLRPSEQWEVETIN